VHYISALGFALLAGAVVGIAFLWGVADQRLALLLDASVGLFIFVVIFILLTKVERKEDDENT
jgi:zinc transporter ZupT